MALIHCECEFVTTPLSVEHRKCNYPPEAKRQLLHPKDIDLAAMACIEYWMDLEDVCIHSCLTRMIKKGDLTKMVEHLVKNDWRLLATFRKSSKSAKQLDD